jgi:RNA-binding protein YhbY
VSTPGPKQPLHKLLGLPKPRGPYTPLKPGAKKPRARPVQYEEQYQRNVADYFGWALPKDAVWYAVPNGGWRTKGIAARLKACGVKKGVGDFVILYRTVHHELELKWDSYSSPEQKAHAVEVVAAGGKYGIARKTLEDVSRQLDEWGIPHARVSTFRIR